MKVARKQFLAEEELQNEISDLSGDENISGTGVGNDIANTRHRSILQIITR